MKALILTIVLLSSQFIGGTKNVTPPLQNVDIPVADTLGLTARSAILVEPNSGKVIYEKDADVKLFPASMTKMMGMYIILERIDQGKIKWTDLVTTSEVAKSMGGTQIYLEPGEQMSVEDMFKAVAINSANDAIVALGEHVSGSLSNFIKEMNSYANKFSMDGTHFNNATGFDDPDHYTTARDMAIIGSKLINYEAEVLRFTSLKEAYVRENTDKKFWLVNTNKLLGHYEGMDGLKTGYTTLAGYNLTATATRQGVRVLSVVMKEQSIKERSSDTVKLLNYGFGEMEKILLYPVNHELMKYTFENSIKKDVGIYPLAPIEIVVKKGTKLSDLKAEVIIERMSAPINAYDVIGYVLITDPDGDTYRYKITVHEVIEKTTFFDYLFHNLKILFR